MGAMAKHSVAMPPPIRWGPLKSGGTPLRTHPFIRVETLGKQAIGQIVSSGENICSYENTPAHMIRVAQQLLQADSLSA